jgi:D-alanyl-D-alanine carboxypeptidase
MQKYISFLFLLLVVMGYRLSTQEPDLSQLPPQIPKDQQDEFFICDADSQRCIKNIAGQIDQLLSRVKSSRLSVSVYSINQGKYIYRKNSDLPLTPASNTKLMTTFCAFEAFGSSYPVKTEILTDDDNLRDSIINGNLFIVGYGDALLKVSDIEYMADKIRQMGIKEIKGNIYCDSKFYDTLNNRFYYSGDHDEVERLPLISALTVERNVATVIATSGNQSGKPVNVNIIPQSESFQINVTATVRGGVKKAKSELPNTTKAGEAKSRAGDELYAKSRKRSSITIQSRLDKKINKQNFYINGSLAANKTYSMQHFIQQPQLAVGGAMKSRLISGGVRVLGSVKDISEYPKKDYDLNTLNVFSRSILEILKPINRDSDNFLAENIFKMLGAYAGISSDCAKGARKYEKETMAHYQIPFDKCSINDGSGLSRRNLLTTTVLTQILIKAYYSDFYKEFCETLSLAGKYGTLRNRMKMTAAYNNLQAKTGTLGNASALSGYVRSLDGEVFVFSCIFNGSDVGTYKMTEDRIGSLLASFFYDAKDMTK